jgi:FixJ family two-component response regulator
VSGGIARGVVKIHAKRVAKIKDSAWGLSILSDAGASGAMTKQSKQCVVAVVDDEQAPREAIVSLLRSVEVSVESFASAEDFLRLRRPEVTYCLVLDVRLTGMSGLDLQRHLADTGSAVPIVFISAQADRDGRERRQALQAGALTWLRKPFDDEDLLSNVRRAFEDADVTADAPRRRQGQR